MALIVPDSSVSLYADVPISDGQELLFKSKSEQNTYFARKKIASRVDCTYLRKTGKLRIEWSTATVQRANFISFKNPSFENITFYFTFSPNFLYNAKYRTGFILISSY